MVFNAFARVLKIRCSRQTLGAPGCSNPWTLFHYIRMATGKVKTHKAGMQSRACKTMTTKRIHSSLTSSTRCRFQSDNPKAAASQAHSRYEAYKSSQTIGAAFGSGCTRLDLQFDMDRGYLIVLKGDPTSSPAGVLVPQFAVGQVKHDSCASGSPLLISTSPGTSIKKRARFKQPDPTTFVTSQPLQDVPQVSRALEGRGETLEAEIRQGLFNIMPQAISAEAGFGLQCFLFGDVVPILHS